MVRAVEGEEVDGVRGGVGVGDGQGWKRRFGLVAWAFLGLSPGGSLGVFLVYVFGVYGARALLDRGLGILIRNRSKD